MIRRGARKKGPDISVPGAAKGEAPPPGRSSFATRVKTRRRKSQASSGAAPPRAIARKPLDAAPGKPKTQPALLTREERLALATGRTHRAPTAAQTPTPATTATPPPRGSTPAAPSTTARGRAAQRSRDLAPKPQAEPDEGFVAVGRVQGPFGLKGELKVLSLTDNPDRFLPKAKLWAGQQPVTVAAVREAQGYVYLTLKGFHDRTSVDKFRHALLQVPEADLPELEEGEYYRFQLIGLTVVDRAGEEIGTLAEVSETGATDVYRVRTPEGKDVLLAATADVVVSVDLKAKRMVVDPPPCA
ncbi:MAG: 16S rRNA processing protein RimM [Chloroflexi bacterium]|nr:16S rRNA processing protein RimM [Chloroflexota bacterium]